MFWDWLKDWAIVISAGATFILALAAFWVIWQNYNFRKKDRELNFKLRLLDEVRDWAREAVRWGFKYDQARSKKEMREAVDTLNEVAKTTDAARIAGEVFGDELIAPVDRAMKALGPEGKPADKEFYASLYELLRVIINLKKKLYCSK